MFKIFKLKKKVPHFAEELVEELLHFIKEKTWENTNTFKQSINQAVCMG
jgi:hypothetical protein